MQSASTSDNIGWIVGAGITAAALTVHAALVVATPGRSLTDLSGTISAAMAGDIFTYGEVTTSKPVFIAILVAAAAAVTIVIATVRRRRLGRPKDGFASAKDLERAVGTGHELTASFARLEGRPVRARIEDQMVVVAPPGAGKTTMLAVGMVADAQGPVVVTSTKVDLLRLTQDLRASLANPDGTPARIHVFDPAGVSRWPTRTTWDIVAGCEDPLEADARASAMVRAAPLGQGRNVDFFEKAAGIVLASLLRAAALGGKTIRDVNRWAKDFSDEEPYIILRTQTPEYDQSAKQLAKFCRADARETIDSTAMSLSLILKPLSILGVDEAVMTSRNSFDVHSFLGSNDTLYLISEAGGEDSVAPLVTALVASVTRAAQKISQRTESGALDRPLLLMLDEVANIAPIPNLPSLMSEGRSRHIQVCAVFQSQAQLRERWGEAGGQTVFNAASVKLMLGGLAEADFLESVSRLAGERQVERRTTQFGGAGATSVSTERERVIALAEIAQLQVGTALMFYRHCKPAVVVLIPWWLRKDARRFHLSEKNSLALESMR
jgi:type IV secretory pathway TraG/TraD family ATPase VirD4